MVHAGRFELTEVTQVPGFWSGFRRALPISAAIAPFGLLFGAVAVERGLTDLEAVAMSTLMFAGASQLVGLNLFNSMVPAWLVVLSIFAVNFRHILYSAAIGPKLMHWQRWQRAVGFFVLTDPQFAESERMAETRKVPFSWYAGLGLTLYLLWIVEAYVGAHFGALIDDHEALGFDFILPLYFFAMVFDFRKRRPFWPIVLASGAGAIAAERTIGSPWHVSIGALCGIAVAVLLAYPKPDAEQLAEEAERAPSL